MLEIIKNFYDNKRRIYDEPSIEIYDDQYFKSSCGGFDLFHISQGKILDDVRKYILDLRPLKKHYSALDIGCGRGELVFGLAEQGLAYVVGIDLSEDAIRLAQQTCSNEIKSNQVAIQKMSATQLDFANETFDIAYMTDIVEHLSDQNLKKAISEAYRILKPGGCLIVHTLPTVNFKLYGQYLTKYYFNLKGKQRWTPTAKEEVSLGHINIQSKDSLESCLQESFQSSRIQVFYGPVNPNGYLKKIVSMLNLWTIISPHLWAIATK